MRRRVISAFSFTLILSSLSLWGCNLDNKGDPPPRGLIYLPAGLLLSAATGDEPPRFMYVVNSNFDLRYNAGSLQAYDLEALDRAIGDCAERQQLGAVRCELADTEALLADEVLVPSLTTYVAANPGHTRIYVATRTDTNLTVVDANESSDRPVSCGDTDRVCDAEHTHWQDPIASQRDLSLPREAVGIATGRAQDAVLDIEAGTVLEGDLLLVAHRGGEVSSLLDTGSELQLQDVIVLGGSTLPLREPTAIAFDPVTHLAYLTIFARDLPELADKKALARVGVQSSGSKDFPSTLFDSGAISLEGVSLGRDTRGIALNPTNPGQALVTSRAPNAVLWVDLAGTQNGESEPTQALVKHGTTVGRGPSRIITGPLGDRMIAIVSCFDSRQIYIMDAATSELLSVVHNFSGPFEMGLDSARKRLYVADFRSSVVRVLDLAPILEGATETLPTASIVATLGHPQLVQELQ
jgi:DNA-binding beta-propeller fold protein YncE